MTYRRQQHLAFAAAFLAVLGVVVAAPAAAQATGATGPPSGTVRAAADRPLSAQLPDPAIVAQGVSSANQAHLFRGLSWDFTAMRAVFNTVALLPGDQATVAAARAAGLAVVLEFDYKADFFAGKDITAKVAAVADQIRAHPGTVAAVHVADRLNERYSAAQGLRYLAATGGVLHRLVPGVPVLVNASDWELTCGLPEQSSCTSHAARFQYETNATLDAFARSGYLDGINIADNIKNLDAAVQQTAWLRARVRWPRPFLLWATCSQLSFSQPSYPGVPAADPATRTYMLAPLAGGADAVALWAWHQLYRGAVSSFLNKDGSSNALWASMSAAAHEITAAGREGRATLVAVPPRTSAPLSGRWAAALFAGVAVLVLLAALGMRAAASTRRGRQRGSQNSSA